MAKVVLAGYYGYDNTGDEAILAVLTDYLKRDGRIEQITVFSHHPQATARDYEVQAVFRYNPVAILRALREGDGLVLAGGLMQDVTSTRSLWYYLTLTRLALRLGKKVYWHAMGIGPILRPKNRTSLLRVAAQLRGLSVRDEVSASFFEEARLVPDPALLLEPAPQGRVQRIFKMLGEPYSGSTIVGFALRPWEEFPAGIEYLAELADELVRRYDCRVLFLPLYPNQDLPVIYAVMKSMKEEALCLELPIPPGDMAGMISRCDVLVSMRLHGLILAAVGGTGAVGLQTDPKVGAFGVQLDEPVFPCVQGAVPVEEVLQAVGAKLRHVGSYDRTKRSRVLQLQEQARAGLKELVDDLCS